MVNLDEASISIEQLRSSLAEQAAEMHVEINIMSERVFSAMHRV